VKVEIAFTADQLGEIAASVVAEMERQGKVMVEPVRKTPYSLKEAAHHMAVSERTIKRWIESGRINTVPGCGRILIIADSLKDIQKGVA
jgi:excisionase family DNA binding protein